jgi:hypothetical protein
VACCSVEDGGPGTRALESVSTPPGLIDSENGNITAAYIGGKEELVISRDNKLVICKQNIAAHASGQKREPPIGINVNPAPLSFVANPETLFGPEMLLLT